MPLRQRPARPRRVDREVAGPPVVEEDRYVPPPRPPRPPRPPLPQVWPWLLLLLLLVIGGLLAAYFLTRDNDHKKGSASAVTVPAVVGLKQNNAVHRLGNQGLVPQLASRPSKFPAGTVFAQNPGAGTSVSRGSLVKLSVSAAAQVPVPNLVGTKTSVAVSQLKAAGLQAQVTTVPAKAAPGVVVKESPVAGTNVAKGSTVSLRASKGQSTVPDVRGQPAADAKAALQSAGLVPAEFQVSSTEPKGTVTAQKPLPDKKVPSGSKVRINVSSGSGAGSGGTTTGGTTNPASQTVSAPNVLRLQQSTAQRRLHDAGLKARVRYVVSGQPAGQVLGQNPGGGTTVKRGTTVVLAVSRGPNPTLTVVPDVVGKDKQMATTTLQNAGFTVQVLEVPTSTPSQSGKVLDEQPAGGIHAPEGSSVTIYVGS